jgi:FkbM family methyltransferase
MSWTLDFIRQWRDHVTLPSIWRLRARELRQTTGRLRGESHLIPLRCTAPISTRLTIRENIADYWTLKEIVVSEVYGGLIQHLGECRTIIDLGANIGLATLYFAEKFPHARILSVEPESSNFAMLLRNVRKLATKGRCVPLQAALWSKDSRLDVLNPGVGHNAFAFGEKSDGEVRGLSIMTILERSGFETVDLLKADIEGAEVELFSGSLDWLPRVRVLAVEFHGDARKKSRFDEIMSGRQILDMNDHTVLAFAP